MRISDLNFGFRVSGLGSSRTGLAGRFPKMPPRAISVRRTEPGVLAAGGQFTPGS